MGVSQVGFMALKTPSWVWWPKQAIRQSKAWVRSVGVVIWAMWIGEVVVAAMVVVFWLLLARYQEGVA